MPKTVAQSVVVEVKVGPKAFRTLLRTMPTLWLGVTIKDVEQLTSQVSGMPFQRVSFEEVPFKAFWSHSASSDQLGPFNTVWDRVLTRGKKVHLHAKPEWYESVLTCRTWIVLMDVPITYYLSERPYV